MLKLRKVAVTGSLSCGKSSVCHLLEEFGAYVVSADKIVHQLQSTDTNLIQKIIKLLGSEIVVNGQLDRAKIANKVFRDPKLLQELEQLVHPVVRDEIERQYQEVKQHGTAPLFVAEIPLLFESGGEDQYDATVVVDAKPDICRHRFQQTTGYSGDEYDRRMSRQLDREQKVNRADYVITNNGSPEELKVAVKDLFFQLTAPSIP